MSESIHAVVERFNTVTFSVSPEADLPSGLTLIFDDNEWYNAEKVSIPLIIQLIRSTVKHVRDTLHKQNITKILFRQGIESTNKMGSTVLNAVDLSGLTRKYMEELAIAFPEATVEFECEELWDDFRINSSVIRRYPYPIKYEDIRDNVVLSVGDYVCASGLARERGSSPFVAPWKWLRPAKVVSTRGINGQFVTVEYDDGKQVEYSRDVLRKFYPLSYEPVAGGKLTTTTNSIRKIPIYETSTSVDSPVSIDINDMYFYDGVKVNYKYRVARGKVNVGRTPAEHYTIGWVSESDLAEYGIMQSTTE